MQVFSPEWFEQHQGKLLWLLNHWLTRRWFRWVLRIRRCDIGYDKEIIELFPHAYTVLIRTVDETHAEVATDFRTHHKYGKRLFYAFRPIWFALHFWDWLLADRWMPRLSFGFATLTTYPEPSTGTVSCDAGTSRNSVDETITAISTGNGVAADSNANVTVNPRLTASTTTDQFGNCTRVIWTFDTRSISAGAVSAATLSIFPNGSNSSGLGTADFHVAAASPASNTTISASDFQTCGSTSFGSVAGGSWSGVAYNDVALNASGLSNLNPGGISRFCGRVSWDINSSFTGTWVSSASSAFFTFTSDQTGSANDPKLVVTYTITGRFAYQNKLRPAIFTPGHAR